MVLVVRRALPVVAVQRVLTTQGMPTVLVVAVLMARVVLMATVVLMVGKVRAAREAGADAVGKDSEAQAEAVSLAPARGEVPFRTWMPK
jgi:hypothetical protein